MLQDVLNYPGVTVVACSAALPGAGQESICGKFARWLRPRAVPGALLALDGCHIRVRRL
jgi:hypothetical protein